MNLEDRDDERIDNNFVEARTLSIFPSTERACLARWRSRNPNTPETQGRVRPPQRG